MEIIIGIGIFITIILIITGSYLSYATGKRPEQNKIKKRLKKLSSAGVRSEEINILRKRLLSEVSWFNELLIRFPRVKSFDRLLEQANAPYSLGVYMSLGVFLASCGYLVGSIIAMDFVITLLLAGFLGSLPLLYIYSLKKSRMEKFQRQLPDAIDLIGRSLKAGHALSGGLKMVADEFEDPIGTEFGKVFDEINFGFGVPEALLNLGNRVECDDLKFLIVSVIIQRETGGNLAEVLSKIAHLIRERFKLHGRVRTLAAEGKLSAVTLVVLPFLMAFYLLIVNPDYLMLLFTDELGRKMVAAAISMMIIGGFVMKKMVSIKV